MLLLLESNSCYSISLLFLYAIYLFLPPSIIHIHVSVISSPTPIIDNLLHIFNCSCITDYFPSFHHTHSPPTLLCLSLSFFSLTFYYYLISFFWFPFHSFLSFFFLYAQRWITYAQKVGEKVSNLVANGLSNSVQTFLDEVSNLGIPSLIMLFKYTKYTLIPD